MTKKRLLKVVVGSQVLLFVLSVFGFGRGNQLKGPYSSFLTMVPDAEAIRGCGRSCEDDPYWGGRPNCIGDAPEDVRCNVYYNQQGAHTCIEVPQSPACC